MSAHHRRRARRDAGFTLVEVVMAVVLGSIIAGVSVAVMITSVNVFDSTRDLSRDSTDTGLIAAFLYRDAQAAGGTDPVTLAADPSLGVSTTDWGGCTQPGGSLVVRFAWVDRADAASDHPMAVTWALFADGRLVRRACQDGVDVEGAIGEHVAAASLTCRPGPACGVTTTEVVLDVTGSAAKTASTVTLTASMRPDLASAPVAVAGPSGPSSPLVLVGGGACPEVSLGGARTVVLGDVLVDDGCGAGAVIGTLSTLQPTGATTAVTSLRDPYAEVVPDAVGCPGLATAPAGTTVYTTATTFSGPSTLAPGRHVFCQGVTFADGAVVRGTDVFLQVVAGGVTVASGADIDLSAAMSGTYQNLLLSVAAGAVTLAGGPSHDVLRGLVHAPSSVVTVQTDLSAAFGALVADRLVVSGGGVVRLGMPIPTLTVAPATLSAGQVAVAYPSTALIASGGTGPYSWSATGLPHGMTLTTGGILDGVPIQAETATATITVVDSTGLAASVQRSVTIRPQLAIASPTTLPNGQTGTAYATTAVTATGGAVPYAFTATGLPPGLTISLAGSVSGTPTAAGDYNVTVTATDLIGATASRAYTLSIRDSLGISSPTSLSGGTVGTAWVATGLVAAGGYGPYTFSATGLPPGLSITTAGVISGTPTTAGTYAVTASVVDSTGTSATRAYSISVISSTPPSAKPFAALKGFQIMVEGAARLDTWEIEGSVAVGGNLTFRNYQRIAHSQTSNVTVHTNGQPLGLLVGGSVDLTASGWGSELTVDNGWFVVGSATGQSLLKFSNELHLVPSGVTNDYSTPRLLSEDKQSDLPTSQAIKPNAFDFAGTFTSLRSTSTKIGALAPATCPAINVPTVTEWFGTYTLHLKANAVNVWTITLADINRIWFLNSNIAPGGSTELIINVTDAGSLSVPTRYWNALQDPNSSDSILWNYPNATSVSLSGALYGSMLAPKAAVTVSEINVAGQLAAKSLNYSTWSTELAPFDVTVPCIG